jgi:hypothetical protein
MDTIPSYFVSGKQGTVEYLTNIFLPVRISSNGKFLLYQSNLPEVLTVQTGDFILYNINEKEVINEFHWTVKYNQNGSFVFRRDDAGKFKVLYTVEGGFILAVAGIDPELITFSVQWDKTDDPNFSPVPRVEDKEWVDDVLIQWKGDV